MKKLLILSALFVIHSAIQAQNILAPDNNTFETAKLKNGRTEMTYFAVNGGPNVEIGSFAIDIASNDKTISVYTTLQFLNSADIWVDTCISDANTFKPIYRSSFSKDNDYVLKYNKEVTGYHYNKQTKKRTTIQDPVTDAFFDSYVYPYFLGLLPLTTGYKKNLAVYDYKPENKTNITKTRIEEVKNNTYVSTLTGEHKVWQVSVFEEATNDKYEYYIDKDSRRIWKIEILAKGQKLLLINKEIDFNPFVNKFNKEETLKLVNSGNSVIIGQAFARDNKNGGALQGMAILNVNKKQFAAKGTVIVLIPYTDYFKEWIKLNEARQKKFRPLIPLPVGARECIKESKVYDDNGNFEFLNLMPGEYLLTVKFTYAHSASETEVVGSRDTYVNGIYQGSNDITTTHNFVASATANVTKIITIKKDGDKESVKLKKTL